MHGGFPNDYGACLLPLFDAPGRRPRELAREVQLRSQSPSVPLHMHLVLHRNRDTVQRS